MPCIFALFKWIVSQILTKGEKRVFSASQKRSAEDRKPACGMAKCTARKRMGTLHLSKLTRRQRK